MSNRLIPCIFVRYRVSKAEKYCMGAANIIPIITKRISADSIEDNISEKGITVKR